MATNNDSPERSVLACSDPWPPTPSECLHRRQEQTFEPLGLGVDTLLETGLIVASLETSWRFSSACATRALTSSRLKGLVR